MRDHIDALGWLSALWGTFGLLAGASLGVIATGTWLAAAGAETAARLVPALVLLLGAALVLTGAGLAMVLTGRALLGRRATGRLAALCCAVPNLVLVPFGTALGIYTCWVLLNEDARREFGLRS